MPLAYVRTLVVTPSALALPDGPAGEAGKARPLDERRLADAAVARLDVALREQLGKLRGLRVVLADAAVKHPAGDGQQGPAIDLAAARDLAETNGADAVLLVSVDRFGLRTAFFREAWMRAVAHIVMARTGEARGPAYAVGQARTAPRLVRSGFMRSDEDLLSDAAVEACAALVRGLERGDTAPFAADVRVAVIPASVPMEAAVIGSDTDTLDSPRVKSGTASERRIPVPALARQADVLFQPEIGPVAERVEADEVVSAMIGLGLTSGRLWSAGGPDAGAAASIGRAVAAQYVFVSRVRAASVGSYQADDGSESVGDIAEVVADFALIRADDETVLWRSDRSGSARSHIYTPEGARRIRTSVQCIMDAAVAAFAHGRFALEEWMRGRRK